MTSPQNLKWGMLMQIAPQILSCCKISNIRLLALQCSNAVKSWSTPIIENALKRHFKWKNQFNFFWRYPFPPPPVGRGYPLPNTPLPSLVDLPCVPAELQPHFTPLIINYDLFTHKSESVRGCNFNCIIETEGLLKVLKTVRVIYYRPLIESDTWSIE